MPFTAGSVLAAADFNWTSYTPTLTGFTVGNGSVTGRYAKLGKTVIVEVLATLGSTSAVTGALSVNFPFTAARTKSVGRAVASPAGTTNYVLTALATNATGGVSIVVEGTNGALSSISSTSPATWASGGWLLIQVTYESAA